MFTEPTTISSVARLIGETLRDVYGIDPRGLYRESRINTEKFSKPGSRVPFRKMNVLWKLATEAAKDTEFGVKVGSRVTPGDFYVLGHAWLASQSLLGAFHRLARFFDVLSTALSALEVRDQGDICALVETTADQSAGPEPAAMDAGIVALIRMCDFVTAEPVRPQRVVLPRLLADRGVDYPTIVGCAVAFGDTEIWEFRKSDVEAQLTGSIPEVVTAVETIADEYLASLDEGRVAREVRRILIRTMPSGRSNQDSVARHLHRSRSTLQRQLVSEGTSYREILESTRQSLAEKYLRSGEFSQAEIAFMLGFTDQSNFARAFKRWTGMSPGEYRKAA